MGAYEQHLKAVIQFGRRKQDLLNPQKYRYSQIFDDLVEDNTHTVAIVLFRFTEGTDGRPIPNDYIVTAYRKRSGEVMTESQYNYDEESDTLYITFAPSEYATGIELADHILLRINKSERRATGITVFDYSILAQHTELGPRNFPLTGLETAPLEIRELVLEILLQAPVREILALSAYTPTLNEPTPIIAIQPLTITTSTP